MSDVIQAQEARIDSLTLMVERLTAMHAEALAALTESRRPSASESVELARSGVGGNPTTAKVSVVVDRKSTRLNSSHPSISYAVFCLKKKKKKTIKTYTQNIY